MYRQAAASKASLLVVRDRQQQVFGCFASETWRVAPRLHSFSCLACAFPVILPGCLSDSTMLCLPAAEVVVLTTDGGLWNAVFCCLLSLQCHPLLGCCSVLFVFAHMLSHNTLYNICDCSLQIMFNCMQVLWHWRVLCVPVGSPAAALLAVVAEEDASMQKRFLPVWYSSSSCHWWWCPLRYQAGCGSGNGKQRHQQHIWQSLFS